MASGVADFLRCIQRPTSADSAASAEQLGLDMSVNSERSSDTDTGSNTRAGYSGLPRAESSAVEAFAEAWESTHRPPEIAEYLPDASTLRREALFELIRVDLRHRWLRRPAAGANPSPELVPR